jgi:hypothetical protein
MLQPLRIPEISAKSKFGKFGAVADISQLERDK